MSTLDFTNRDKVGYIPPSPCQMNAIGLLWQQMVGFLVPGIEIIQVYSISS